MKLLSEFVKGLDRYLENDVLLQTASFNRNQKDFQNSLISREDYNTTLARINYAIVQIVERLPEIGNTPITNGGRKSTPFALKRTILFLSANPRNSEGLRLDEELRKVKDELSKSTSRDSFEIKSEPAVKISTITQAMQKHKPEIVHFSGHGTGIDGIVVENENGEAEVFPTDALNRLFRLFKSDVKCVLLNACYSKEQAQVISNHGIYTIGMNKDIEDSAAIDFAVGFYQSIGEGNEYLFAYEIAMVNISRNINDANTPEVWLNGNKLNS
ncbi:MAG: CHAT domain-containing protein [Saprospiraceae bacterium]|nr:CHAT domain-containing protein [Candidatus Vicinibacter affinis]